MDALSDLDAVRRTYAPAYQAFRDRFCHLDDGHATARVINRVFTAGPPLSVPRDTAVQAVGVAP
jgi:CDP-glycerol glycerophosphotransferase